MFKCAAYLQKFSNLIFENKFYDQQNNKYIRV
jgi:hypothetical protein